MTQPTASLRVASIDILRALTMVLMIFVNDLWSLKGIPDWLEHTKASEDGMGLADTVFPAFLFIVGMSIPFSVAARRKKGDSTARIVAHIVERAIALLIMGVFLVNGENINQAATGMHRVVWNSICCLSFILLWNSYPKTANKWLVRAAKAVAIIALIVLAFIYRSGKGDDLSGFETHWWGILGLIGWAYLITALIYVLSGNRLIIAVIAWIFFMFICIASHADWIPGGIIAKITSPFGDGAMPAYTMGGVMTSLIFIYYNNQNKPVLLTLVLLLLAGIFLAAGFYTRGFWGISKIRATPAWVLICSAITIIVFVLIYWIADREKKANWFNFIKPAGTNTLLCYLLPYFAYAIVVLLHLSLPESLLTGWVGLLKSLLFALLITAATGLLGRAGVRVRL